MNSIEINPPRTIGRASAESEALIRFLQSAEVGQVITYVEMREACKADVQAHPSHLQTARRNLLKSRIAFGTIAGIGVKRLSDDEIPDEADSKLKMARKAASRGIKLLDCADMAKLTGPAKTQAVTTRTILGFMTGAGSRSTRNAVEQRVIAGGDMKVGKIEELFGK